MSTELRYRKQPWGLVKGFIERNFWSGIEDNFRHLGESCLIAHWLHISVFLHLSHLQPFISPSEMSLTKLEEILTESRQLSPKAKGVKNSTVRRKKRPLPHIRSQHLDEALSPVTTPTDEEVIQRIKHVAGSTQTRHQSPEHHHLPGGFAFYSVSKLLLIISFVYAAEQHTQTYTHKDTITHMQTKNTLSLLTEVVNVSDLFVVSGAWSHSCFQLLCEVLPHIGLNQMFHFY